MKIKTAEDLFKALVKAGVFMNTEDGVKAFAQLLITLKAAEDTAFSRVDEFERTEANIQRVDAQTKKYWGKK